MNICLVVISQSKDKMRLNDVLMGLVVVPYVLGSDFVPVAGCCFIAVLLLFLTQQPPQWKCLNVWLVETNVELICSSLVSV